MTVERAGIVEVSYEALAELLKLPPGHRVVHVFPEDPNLYRPRIAKVIVEGPDLPIVVEGQHYPLVEYRLTKDEPYGVFMSRVDEVKARLLGERDYAGSPV